MGSSASETKGPAENEEKPANAVPTAHQAVPTPIAHDPAPAEALPQPQPIVEEEDDLDVPVQPGTACRRRGCKTTFVSDDENRKGDGEGTQCTYHPAPVASFPFFIGSFILTAIFSPSSEKAAR